MRRWLLLLCMMLATSCGGPTSSSATPTRAPSATAARSPTAAAVATATTAASNTPTRAVPSATVRAVVPATAAPTAASGFTCEKCIKGNINSEGVKIYHLPTCQDYERTVIDTGKGERWFSSEAEARTAGWRKALNCR